MGRSRSLDDYVIFSCRFPEALVEKARLQDLPSDWRSHPGPAALRHVGDAWLRERRSAVLQVPSAVIETENNYLLNPEHDAFGRIRISEAQAFALDMRLLRQ